MKKGIQTMKRVLSLVMAFAMVLTLLPAAVFAAEPTTMTIYFENNWKWPDAKIYWWGSTTGTNPEWPGVELTNQVDTSPNGAARYKVEVPTDITGMLFYGTGEYGAEQSANIESGWYDGICYYMTYDSATNTKPAGSYEYAQAKTPSGETKTVYFDNTAKSWSKVNVYYWDSNATYDLDCTWPGKAMTSEGDNLYSYDVPIEATHLIFNNGSDKTADLTNPNDGNSVYNGSGWNEYTEGGEDADITYYAVGNGEFFGAVTQVDLEKPMVRNASGKYEITYENVSAGSHYFFITDSTGETRYIADNVTITLDAVSNVTITFDAEAKSATYTATPVSTTDPSEPSEGEEETKTITVYFRNDWLWTDVSIHYWNSDKSVETEWPGAAMTLCDNDGTYDIYKAEIPANVTGLIFNGVKNDNSGNRDQTPDITAVTDGQGYYVWWNGSLNEGAGGNDYGTFTYTPGGGGEGSDTAAAYYLVGYINNADYNGQDYQFVDGTLNVTFANDSYVVVKDQTDDWYLTAAYCTETSGTFAKGNKEKMFVAAGSYTFTLVENDDGTLTMSYAPSTGGEGGEVEPAEDVSYAATFHFANTLNWSTVNLYTWIGTDTALTGAWPGSVTAVAGGYYTETVEFKAPEGTALNFIFNNGSAQTVDLKLSADAFTKNDEGVYTAEKWVVLTTKDGVKYNAAIVSSADEIVTSPIVDGSSVTFNYGGSATSVAVAGSFNGWEPADMTKGEDGVWTLTIENLEAGDYQYKFVVDGEYILDPMNSNVVTDTSENQNSAFYILSDETIKDDNTVTINVHYTRADGNYDGWNLWVWGTNMGGHQVDFETKDDDGSVVATIVLKNAREYQDISFKERLSVEGNEWADQGSSDRTIDLSTVVSGTIDYYIPSGNCVYGNNVIRKNKISSVELDYDGGVVVVTSVQAIAKPAEALSLIKGEGQDAEKIDVTITSVGSKYSLALPEGTELKLSDLYLYKVDYYGDLYSISIDAVYASQKFAAEYTYEGEDLGATYTSTKTTFKVWAPTATAVSVKLYATGSDAEAGAADLGSHAMTKGEKGVWTVTVNENLNGTYYTYAVTVDGETVEAVDPYARTTGVNGERGMVIDLDSTDPTGWDSDVNPNKITSYTDAVIYELHVRDFSNHTSSGMTNKGKYLAFTEEGTKTSGGVTTGIDYLDELGVTHVHLLPVYDYGSVDEITCTNFNWGYDPVNYNVPEGSYSTDPYDGAKRVNEFKQMVQSLHDRDISVIMDVVYNHVYDAEEFCFNNIVPGYFSRVSSNASGCGNDTASEREMVRKYIVESVLYWHQEYHIDGFRFDLVGLLDVDTINQIVKEVHACCSDVIFYGEGWDMDSTNKEPGTEMAKQGNASQTPGFAYFSDSVRNGVSGGNDGKTTGFASGAGNGGAMVTEWLANPWWINNPEQVVQYVSCHDNYTLADKLVLSTGNSEINATVIKMNNLAAAFYMTAQGVPFIHAGEEFLREKINSDGSRNHNSYNSSDTVNNIVWSNLEKEDYAANVEYYKGLIAFRAAHPALRMATAAEVKANVYNQKADANLISFWIDGSAVTGETHDSIYVILNAGSSAQTIELPAGDWNVCINGEKAGVDTIETVSDSVSVSGISAMVLVQKETTEKPTQNKSDVALPGSFNSWNQANYMNNTDTEGVVTQTLSLPAGTYTFKIKNGDTWYGNGGTINDTADGWVMDASAGDCTLVAAGGAYTFTFEISTAKLTVTHDPNGGEFGDPTEYYLCGYINGVDYAMDFETGDYKFDENGKLTATFTADSYVMVKNGDSSEKYMTDGYLGAVKSAVLKDTAKCELTQDKWDKLLIPGGEEVVITMVKNDDNTITLSYESGTTAVVDQSGVQNGVTLHCWNWSFANITANMAKIAEQGYTAIQTSPIQPLKEATNGTDNTVGSHWWVYYQPVDFVITTDEGNALGTKADFEAMCAEAEKYGIKVIVDVVANHMANETGNNLSSQIPEKYTSNEDYWHDIATNITDWKDRYDMTQHCMGGLPDLNTGNDDIQKYVLDFLKECVDAGADGFRFDAAKSIETPKDDASFASDFWPTVVNGVQAYADEKGKGDLYIYGEILDEAAIAISAYTQYMSVTDNGWGNHMRSLISGSTAGLVSGFYKSADPSNLVIWAESHDTYATDDESQSSADVSEANINKTWALVAARADAMGLYLARPASNDQALGVASATGWDNAEVKAVNEFHNAFVGQSESIGNENGVSYVERGTSGVVLVNVSAASNDVSVTANAMADGTYIDQITGNTFTVADGKISGTIGDTGIAVIQVENPVASNEGTGVQYKTLKEALNAAQTGETVQLLTDVVESNVVVTDDITLDLNGQTLTTKYLLAFSGSHVVDSATEKGLLIVPKNSIMIQADNAQMPVWNEDNGYIFAGMKMSYEEMTYPEGLIFKSWFKPSFGKLGAEKMSIAKTYFVDEDGVTDNGLQIIIRLSWTSTTGNQVSQDFLYIDALAQEVYTASDKVFTLSITRLASDAAVTVQAVVVSETGAEYVSGGITYPDGTAASEAA